MRNLKTKLKTRLVNVIGAALLIALMMATGVQAAAKRETITLKENYQETSIRITRSKAKSYVSVRCLAVYPTTYYKDEQYTKIRTRLRFFDHTEMSDVYTLIEGEAAKQVRIYEGYLNRTDMYLIFTGNSAKSAYADVEYNPN